VLLDPVVVDHAQLGEALAREVVGEIRSDGAGPTQHDLHVAQLRDHVGPAAVQFLVQQLAGHDYALRSSRAG
jgi:hypothetical protein